MKDFFTRRQATLDIRDLERYLRIPLDDLARALPGHDLRVHLLDAPETLAALEPSGRRALSDRRVILEPDTGRLFLPVFWEDTRLALVEARPAPGRTLPEPAAWMLPALVQLSLEKMLLYKLCITDTETGLYNEDYFRAYLRRHLPPFPRMADDRGRPRPLSLSDAEDPGRLAVLLVEPRDGEKLAARMGRAALSRVLIELAGWLKERLPSPGCLARLDHIRLGLALPQTGLDALEALARELEEAPDTLFSEPGLKIRPAFGLAGHPFEGAEETVLSEADGADLAGILFARADLALHQALADPQRSLFAFHHLLARGGRVVQVLPYHRVMVNLGRKMGAREGQTFVIEEAGAGGGYKGQVVLFDVQDDFAVGEVVDLRHSLSRPQPGDSLVFSRSARETAPEHAAEAPVPDPLLGIPGHLGFVRGLVEQTRDQAAFTVLLIRMDGYDEYRAAMGHQESDREMAALFERVQAGLPENALIGRFSADCLAVSLVGIGPVEAAQMARNWRDQVHQHRRRTCSIGVAVYPTGDLEPSEILVSAQKALEHAGFLGPSSVAVFDAVTLNISGDKKFEAGDFEGALDEYRRALVLSPNDLNVLNSLGVAYGYKKDLDRALETFDRVLALDPENFMAHYNQGFALAMAGRPEDALASFRTAARIAPDHFDILFSWGKMALELDLVDEADQAFERAIRAPGAGPIVYRFRGRTLLRLNRREEAIDAFKAAARHDPEDAESLSHLGTLYLERGTDLDVALSLIRQSVDLDPTNPLFRERLARAYAAAGDLAGAERHWRRALDMGRRSREVYYELGRVMELLGRMDEARPLYEQALALDPEFKPAADALAALGGKKEG